MSGPLPHHDPRANHDRISTIPSTFPILTRRADPRAAADHRPADRSIPSPDPVRPAPPPARPLNPADRRRRTSREFAEFIVARAAWLGPEDRALVEAVYDRGQTAARLAPLLNEPPRTLRRRIRALVARICDPLYAFVALHHESWTPDLRAVALLCILRATPIREAAARLGLTYHATREHRRTIHGLFTADQAARRSPRHSGADTPRRAASSAASPPAPARARWRGVRSAPGAPRPNREAPR